MRGQTVFSYALAAFVTTTHAAPLVERTNEVGVRSPYVVDGKAFEGKVGTVDVGKEFVECREYLVVRAVTSTVSKASATSKPGVAKSTGAKASVISKSGAAKATGKTSATSKPGVARTTGATATKASIKASASKTTATKASTSKPAAAKATTPADLPGCPAPAGKASATKSGAAKATGAARRAEKPLGCDPTKPEVKRADTNAATDPISGLLGGLFGDGATGASPSGAAGGGDLLSGIANAGLIPRNVEA